MELRMVIQCEHLIWSRIAVFVQPSTSNTFKVKKGNICLCVWVLKIMSVFVCSKELCVNIFFDCCKVLAAPLKRTFPPFFSNRMYLLKRQSRKKIQFLTSLASQNRLCWKCKMNLFKLIQCSNVWRYFAVFYICHFLCFHYISEELGYYADLKIRKFRQCHVSKKSSKDSDSIQFKVL